MGIKPRFQMFADYAKVHVTKLTNHPVNQASFVTHPGIENAMDNCTIEDSTRSDQGRTAPLSPVKQQVLAVAFHSTSKCADPANVSFLFACSLLLILQQPQNNDIPDSAAQIFLFSSFSHLISRL